MNHSYAEAFKRIPSQRQKILAALRQNGSKGITNLELAEISQSWWARVQELSVKGYLVEVTPEQDGVYKYVLVSEPEKENPMPKKAIDILIDDIENIYGGTVTTQQLLALLNKNKFSVKRKQGFYKEQKVS